MRTITVINLKGGVGKTTTVINMAALLALADWRVLCIDCDPQANLSWFFGARDPETLKENTTAQLLNLDDEGRSDVIEDYIRDTQLPGVSLIPASIDLIEADIASIRQGARGVKAIRDLIETLDETHKGVPGEDYDFCLIDCPPSFTAASVAAIYAADDVIIPVEADPYSVGGMAQLLRQIESVREIQPRIRVAGVLITKWHKTAAVIQGEAALRGSGVPVFRTNIRRSDKVTEAAFMARSLDDYSRRSAAAIDYHNMVAEYLEGVIR